MGLNNWSDVTTGEAVERFCIAIEGLDNAVVCFVDAA